MKPSTIPRALPFDMPIGNGIQEGENEDFLAKGHINDVLNYRALEAVSQRIQPVMQYTDPGMVGDALDPPQPPDPTGEIQPVLGIFGFEDAAGNGYAFVASARRIYRLTMPGRTLPAPYAAGDLTSIYATGTISSLGVGQARIAGGDGNGTTGTNLWPIKVGDILRYLGVSYTITAITGSNPCDLTTNPAFPGAVAAQPYEIRRLFTCNDNDTFTHCAFNQSVMSGVGTGPRIVITNGGGQGAMSDGQMCYDPILYWDASLASFQPLPGTNNLRGRTGGVIHAMTAAIVLSYKEMLLAMNLRERETAAGVWQAWENAPNRLRNSDIGDSQAWTLVGGVGYASWLDLTDTPGGIEAAVNWKDTVIIAKRDEVQQMAFTGGTNPVFMRQKILHNEGCQYRHGLVALREEIVMIGNRDFYRIVEGLPYVMGMEIKERFFADIDELGARQTFAIRWKQHNEIWFFCRSKGFGVAYSGCDTAYIWNYEHNTWTRVDTALTLGGAAPTKRGITCAAVLPYLRVGTPWESLMNISWTELTTAGTTWDDLMAAATMETALMGSCEGDLATFEGGEAMMPGGHALVALNERDGFMETGLLALGAPDFYKRLVGITVAFEGKSADYEFQILSSAAKCEISAMEGATLWLAEDTPIDITAKYFVVRMRQATADIANPSEVAQLRLRYYLRGQR